MMKWMVRYTGAKITTSFAVLCNKPDYRSRLRFDLCGPRRRHQHAHNYIGLMQIASKVNSRRTEKKRRWWWPEENNIKSKKKAPPPLLAFFCGPFFSFSRRSQSTWVINPPRPRHTRAISANQTLEINDVTSLPTRPLSNSLLPINISVSR
jgi:hypothetical protein